MELILIFFPPFVIILAVIKVQNSSEAQAFPEREDYICTVKES